MKIYISFLALLLLFSSGLTGQSKQLKKAAKLFKAHQYTEAARYYESALEAEDNDAVRAKLAYCYLQNNRTERAEELLSEVVTARRVRSENVFLYAETLRANGKYEAARQQYLKYNDLEPGDEQTALALSALETIQRIEPLFGGALVTPFSQNTKADDSTPIRYGDRVYFSSDRSPGAKMLKQKSGWTGRDFLRIYVADALPGGGFENAKEIDRLNELNKHVGNPTLTADGNTIYFTKNNHKSGRGGMLNMALYVAHRNPGGDWGKAEPLPFCSPEFNFMHPAVSPDGKFLFFTSDKSRSIGGTDIWWVKKKRDGSWGRSQNLGTLVNTVANEGYPFFDTRGRLYFCSKGHPGYGGFDIFEARRDADGNWLAPVNLGEPINSSRDDISFFLNEDARSGMFSSSRGGEDDDIYLFELPAQ